MTETTFQILDLGQFTRTVEWYAMMEWVDFHELDPMKILCDREIKRLPEQNAIETEYVMFDEDGKVKHIGCVILTEEVRFVNEGPPLPFPAELFEPLP